MTETTAPRKTPAKATIASWIGTTLEYYDFAVYATASALVFNVIFFPPGLPDGVRLMLSLATLGVGYLVRPLGAFILGPLGDRFGRKFVMLLTLFGIGACTFLIGCLPTFSDIGIWAPILLVLIRMIQGLSVSGEQAAAITMTLEHSPDHRRSFTTSFVTSGSAAGGLLSTAIFIPFVALPQEQLLTWGWRIPFWLSAVVVVVAYIIRRTLEEPPAFLEAQATQVNLSPLKQALQFHWSSILRIAACAMIAGVSYLFATFSVGFATTGYKLDRPTMLWVPVLASLLALLYTPLAGWLADKIGRKPVFIIGAAGAGLHGSLPVGDHPGQLAAHLHAGHSVQRPVLLHRQCRLAFVLLRDVPQPGARLGPGGGHADRLRALGSHRSGGRDGSCGCQPEGLGRPGPVRRRPDGGRSHGRPHREGDQAVHPRPDRRPEAERPREADGRRGDGHLARRRHRLRSSKPEGRLSVSKPTRLVERVETRTAG